jgi:nickel-dependent lactate racemase
VTLPASDRAGRLSLLDVISPREVKPALDEGLAIERALDTPLGTPRLDQLVRPGHKIVIVVDDYTRPTPVARILPHVLARLHAGGASPAAPAWSRLPSCSPWAHTGR